MNVEYFIASKVAGSGQKSFSRLIIRIAIVAVALSVAVMICATALISGFKKEISNKIFGFWGHIHITDADYNRSLLDMFPIKKNQDFYPYLDTVQSVGYIEQVSWLGMDWERERSTNGGIEHIHVYALKPGIIEVKGKDKKAKKAIEGIILKGIGSDFNWEYMDQYMIDGEPLDLVDSVISEDIVISNETANRLKIGVGDRFTVHFVEPGGQLKRRLKVKGIYKTGLAEYDKKFALIDIKQIQGLQGWRSNEVSGFEVFVEDLDDLLPLTEYIYYERVPNELYAETIREKLPEIFEWLDLQDINEVVILFLMFVVAIINMITALLILILERTNMIGILKALGTSNWSIQKIFLYYAGYIIIYGLFFGNLIGLGLCFLQDQFEIIRLDEANYYLTVAPVDFNFWNILLVNLGTFLITLIFLVLPSYLVTNIDPVKAIRFK